jgi:hypothetical protein
MDVVRLLVLKLERIDMHKFVPKLHTKEDGLLALTIDGKFIGYADVSCNTDNETLLKLDNRAAKKIGYMDAEQISYSIEV